MKKVFYIIAALALFAGCTKEATNIDTLPQEQNAVETPETPAVTAPVKINFEIAALGEEAQTKAVKQGWEAGDRVYIWFGDVMESDFVIRDCDLILAYNGSAWDEEYQVAGLSDWLIAKKTNDNAYFVDNNGNGTYDEGVDEIRTAYYAPSTPSG